MICSGSEEGADKEEAGRKGAIGGGEKGSEAGRRRGPCQWPSLRRA